MKVLQVRAERISFQLQNSIPPSTTEQCAPYFLYQTSDWLLNHSKSFSQDLIGCLTESNIIMSPTKWWQHKIKMWALKMDFHKASGIEESEKCKLDSKQCPQQVLCACVNIHYTDTGFGTGGHLWYTCRSRWGKKGAVGNIQFSKNPKIWL